MKFEGPLMETSAGVVVIRTSSAPRSQPPEIVFEESKRMISEDKLLVRGMKPPCSGREFSIVGKSVNRQDGVEKVTGRAEYSGDIKLPRMLYAKLLHAPHLRARIRKIDASEAEALPGVRAVLTKNNTPGWRTYWYEIPEIAFPECITYEGQEVAAVAAEDILIAQEALDLINVEYDILTPMVDAEVALKNPPLPSVADEEYPGRDVFDRKPSVVKRGDLNKGFAEAEVILERTYTTQPSYHATIQTRACLADWDGQRLTVFDATQGVWNSKEALAKSLGLHPDSVRVVVNHLGGGFGSKAWAQRISFYAAKLAIVTGRPVRLERTRREEFLNHPHRWDCKIHIRMGARKDGTLAAIYQRAIVNIGAAASSRNYYPISFNWHVSNLYECPNVHLEQIGVYTNLQLTGPTRAPLNMTAIFALESHMDEMAEALGIDPLELRFRNYSTFGRTHIYPELRGQEVKIPYSSKHLDRCMKLVTDAIGWEKRKELKSAITGGKRRGIGMAAFMASQGSGRPPNTAYADVVITCEGTIELRIGIVDIGGGQKTIFSMIAAEELGVRLEDIRVVAGDTQNTRYGPSCHASRVTAEMGPAVLQAAADARRELFEIAAEILGVEVNKLQSQNGEIFVKEDPSRSILFTKACSKIDPRFPIRGYGSRAPNPHDPMFATFGAQAAEVEVDMETGEVRVLRIAAAQDFGKAINPKFCISQIYGGVQFGLGYALWEEGVFDPKTGKMLNNNFHQYRMPTSLDFPHVEAFLVESHDPYFAYSAKGGAEVTNTPTPAAIRNAIYHATGIWLNKLPMSPDKILEAIHSKSKKGEKNAL
jgi:CO/xanthine dehydrogenase Mo-binding subunit